MKIIIFYSSIGQGHISAARAIEREVLRKNPSATVLTKDIRQFMDPVMPVSVPACESGTSKECLAQIGFTPNIKTITIASGKEGAGDFPGLVMSIANETKEPLQIIAVVCGRNNKQRRSLRKVRQKIPSLVKLEILGFISQTSLISFIQASDLFITKAGGLSPAEAFTIGKASSGHNARTAVALAHRKVCA